MNSEKKRIDATEQEAERYIEKFRPWMESVQNHSPLARARQHGCTAIDMVNLGQMLEQYEAYQSMVEADGNMSHLGTIPNVAYDILSVNFGASPINVIASVQPMEDLQGFVAFKDWTAQNTRGNVTSGQKNLVYFGCSRCVP